MLSSEDLLGLGMSSTGRRRRAPVRWPRVGIAWRNDEGRPRGYLLWDTWGKVDEARERIRAAAPLTEGALLG